MKKRAISFVVIFILMFGLLAVQTAFAADATVSLSGGGTYEKGDSFYVTLTYSGDTYGAATATITYDSSVLEYQSCDGAEAYGSGGTVKITMSSGSGTTSLSCKLKFTATAVGSSTVTATTLDVYNLDLEELSASTKSIKVTVNNTETSASTNANLSSLLISSGTLSPSFSASTTSYTVNVSNDVTVCTISAKTADSNATYTVTGSKNLSVGTNVRTVVVTAESGATKTYTITIVRAAATATDGSDTNDDSNVDDDSITGEDDQSEDDSEIEVIVGDKTYYIQEDYSLEDIPSGFHLTTVTYAGEEILAIADSDENLILCLLKDGESGDQIWFFYDAETETFSESTELTAAQILEYMADDNAVEAAEEDAVEAVDDTDDGSISATNAMLIVFAATAVLLAVVLVVFWRKRKK